MIKAEKSKKVDEWEINEWVRTLEKAEEIKNDPAKMKLLKPHLKRKIKSIADLRKIIEEGEEGE